MKKFLFKLFGETKILYWILGIIGLLALSFTSTIC